MASHRYAYGRMMALNDDVLIPVITDKESDRTYCHFTDIVECLNQMDVRVKELEKENDMLKKSMALMEYQLKVQDRIIDELD